MLGQRSTPMLKTFALLLITSAVSFAATISGTNVVLSTNTGYSDYQLTIYQDSAATDFTSIFFDHQGQSLIFRDYNIDEGSDWYFANFNNVFTASTISQAAQFLFCKSGDQGWGGSVDFMLR
jgi:hypothetical protein